MIRSSTELDCLTIQRIYRSAFGEKQGQEIFELVIHLFRDETAQPLLSLVAERAQTVVGHLLFTPATLQPEEPRISAQILAPLAVSSEFQGQGIGTALITAGCQQLSESAVDLVFVLGHPSYYPRHGFQPAGRLGLDAPYPIPIRHADAWMVRALTPGVLGHVQGTIHCAEALSDPRYWQE